MKHVVAVLLVFLSVSLAFAESDNHRGDMKILTPDNDPHVNLILGVSPFVGIVGIEGQKGEHAIAVGFPARIAYRYFSNPYGDTKFFGSYAGHYSIEDYDKSFEGIRYEDFETTYIGFGAGYRWQWASGWNVNISLSLEYAQRDYENPDIGQSASEKVVYPFPGLNVGYKF